MPGADRSGLHVARVTMGTNCPGPVLIFEYKMCLLENYNVCALCLKSPLLILHLYYTEMQAVGLVGMLTRLISIPQHTQKTCIFDVYTRHDTYTIQNKVFKCLSGILFLPQFFLHLRSNEDKNSRDTYFNLDHSK